MANGSLFFEAQDGPDKWHIGRIRLNEPGPANSAIYSLQRRYARASPNGHWLAYTSANTRTEEVYVRSLSGTPTAIQVSIAGGSQPVWSGDSADLYFVGSDRMLVRSHINFESGRADSSKAIL